MKRGEKDVAWSTISHGWKCLFCAQPAIQVEPDHWQCVNDPECLAAAEEVAPQAAALEAEIEANKEKLLRTMNV